MYLFERRINTILQKVLGSANNLHTYIVSSAMQGTPPSSMNIVEESRKDIIPITNYKGEIGRNGQRGAAFISVW